MDRKRKRECFSVVTDPAVGRILTWGFKGELLDTNTRAWAGDKGTFLLYIGRLI